MARDRLRDAAPGSEAEKYGDGGKVDYHALKNRFQSLSKVHGMNYFDVLSEMPKWFKGAPRRLVEAFQGAENPRKAVKAAWKELDGYYAVHIQTAAERIRPIVAKGKVGKNDVSGLMELMAELKATFNESKYSGVEGQLDQQDIIREVIMAKVPHMADKFYEKEARKMKKDKRFKFKFQDLISEVADRAQVLKLQGKNTGEVKGQQTAKVAVMTSGAQGSFRDVLRDSPPKQQGPLPPRQAGNSPKCRFCLQGHLTESCSRLSSMSLQQRFDSLKKAGFCYRCLHKGHVAKDCGVRQPPICKTCKLGHQSILHTVNGMAPRPTQRDSGVAPAGANTNQEVPNEVDHQEASTSA